MTDPIEQDEILDGPVFEEPEPVYAEPVKTPAPDDIPEGDAA